MFVLRMRNHVGVTIIKISNMAASPSNKTGVYWLVVRGELSAAGEGPVFYTGPLLLLLLLFTFYAQTGSGSKQRLEMCQYLIEMD